jgi:two-component system KDP operon response regulator KdpE
VDESGALVLVIDDDAGLRRVLRTALETNGYHSLLASSATQGMREALSCNPDVVLLDLGLPDGDGAEMIARMRESSAVPILVVSVHSDEATKIAALDQGANDYITKPFSTGELMARIRVALRKNRDTSAEVVHVGRDIHVDLARRMVFVRGNEVHLAPVEFKLLTALVRNPERVITHAELTHLVWGPDGQPVQTLRVYMTHLRHKLERHPTRPRHLLTETGVGYRLRLSE